MSFVFAYVDAGTGSLIIQAIIAAIVAGPILARDKIAKGVRALRRSRTRVEGPAGDAPRH